MKNKSCVITGASDGLGLEIAKKFISEGYNVAICARNEKKLKNSVDDLLKIKKENQIILSSSLDVSNELNVNEFIKYCIKYFIKVDVLINCAGIYGPFDKIEDTNSEEWKKCIDINLMGPYYTMKYVIPHMKENKRGKIINIAGGGATQPMPFISSYAASKCAIVRLTETVSKEVKDFNIDVNSISPGLLETNMYTQAIDAGPEKIGKEFFDKITNQEKTPLSKAANLCYYLASKESDGITGKLISAVWDNYRNFTKEDLKNDKYTLRRIDK